MNLEDKKRLVDLLKTNSECFYNSLHGLGHWLNVERNGLHIAKLSGADPEVVSYFAYLHDCKRTNDKEDFIHGKNAADFAIEHREFISLDDKQFEMLVVACCDHTLGTITECPTIGTCWDADRLELTRVGFVVNPTLLNTQEAKRIAIELDYSCLSISK